MMKIQVHVIDVLKNRERTHEVFEMACGSYHRAACFLWRIARKFIAYHRSNYYERRNYGVPPRKHST